MAYFCDYRGVTRRQLTLPDTYGGFITFREDYFWMLARYTSGAMQLTRPEVPMHYTHTAGTSHGQPLVYMYGTFDSAVVTKNQIVINTDRAVYMFDCRYHTAPNVFRVMEYSECFAVNDSYIAMHDPDADLVKLYQRDSITTYSEVMTLNRWCNHCDISQTKICCEWDAVPIFDINTQTRFLLKNYAADESYIRGVFFIYGDLYIVREQGVYKFIPEYGS